MKQPEYLIETDILIEHLTHNRTDTESVLEKLMQKGVCYTSAINASEVLFHINNDDEKENAVRLLSSLKVLGINSRYSLNISGLKSKLVSSRDSLIFILAKMNKLKIVTCDKTKYSKVAKQVTVIKP